MPLLSRIANVFRQRRLAREIDEEMASHLAEAAARGRDAAEAGRAFGSSLRHRESSREARIVGRLDSLRADAIFGCRQLLKRKAASVTAILSLALAIGSCASAFRLIDAMLLRPLPVAHADRLYYLERAGIGFHGEYATFDGWAYPAFQTLRAAVRGEAELIAVSRVESQDITYRSDAELEKGSTEYVSAWMFDRFGLRPALGRLFTDADDAAPGAAPYAVLSYDYWMRRFGGERSVIGRRFRFDKRDWEIVGVAPRDFAGTETGSMPDLFLPAMMNAGAIRNDQTWIRTLAIVNPRIPMEPLRAKLDATCRAWETERAKGFGGMNKTAINHVVDQRVQLEPAAAGISDMQQSYGRSLVALGILVGLVLLIACVNVANLMTIQAAGRAREMALRVSIGAGRGRLMQLVLVESAILATLASAAGALFAWWSGPFVVAHLNPADSPARLVLASDWRIFLFGLGLTFLVTMLFGLAPALRASAVKPALILKGGGGPHSRRRSCMRWLRRRSPSVSWCSLPPGSSPRLSNVLPAAIWVSPPTGCFRSRRLPPSRSRRSCGNRSPIACALFRAWKKHRSRHGRCSARTRPTASSRSTARLRDRSWPISCASRRAGSTR
jgi:predicted permease